MSIKIADRLFETTTSTGSGPFLLQGAVEGFQTFQLLTDGAKTAYYIDDADAETGVVQNWMAVIGTVTTNYTDTTSLSVDTVLASSEGGGPVDFGSGTKNVRGGIPAQLLPLLDENLNDTRLYGVEGGSSEDHLVFLAKEPFDYSDGMPVIYRPSFTNTVAEVTLSVNGLSSRPLKINGADPAVGALPAGRVIIAVYNGVNDTFEIANGQNGLPLTGGNMTGAINEALTTKASATTPDIWTGTGNKINYTGTATATGFADAPQAGSERTLICAGAAKFTAGANMLIDGVPSGSTITLAAGDRVILTALSATQFRLQIIKANGANTAKAWVKFNGNGSITVLDSFNVASVVRNGVGDYTVNFATPLNNANYSWTASGQRNSTSDDLNIAVAPKYNVDPTVNGFRFIIGAPSNNSLQDCINIRVQVFGS